MMQRPVKKPPAAAPTSQTRRHRREGERESGRCEHTGGNTTSGGGRTYPEQEGGLGRGLHHWGVGPGRRRLRHRPPHGVRHRGGDIFPRPPAGPALDHAARALSSGDCPGDGFFRHTGAAQWVRRHGHGAASETVRGRVGSTTSSVVAGGGGRVVGDDFGPVRVVLGCDEGVGGDLARQDMLNTRSSGTHAMG